MKINKYLDQTDNMEKGFMNTVAAAVKEGIFV